MEENDKKLTIPSNIPLRWELFRGYGKKELIKTLLVTAVVIAIDIIFYLCTDFAWRLIACVIFTLFAIFISILFYEKMDNNLSAYDYFKNQIEYNREQQKFLYKSKKEEIYVNH